MWTLYQNRLSAPKKKKEAKEALTLPAISSGPTSQCQRTMGHKTKLNEKFKTPDYLRVQSDESLPGLHEFEKRKSNLTKLLKNVEALMGDIVQEEDKDCIQEDSETDGQTVNQRDGVKMMEKPPSLLEEKRFMVYICGGYKDTAAERRALMENVYPRLYLYCKQRGYDFRMVDLRWGVRDPTSEHHDTVQLHVENLQQCRRSMGPNFILFVGQKLEVRGLPTTITREAFDAMMTMVSRDQQMISKSKPVESIPASGPESVRKHLHVGKWNTNSGLLSSHGQFSDGKNTQLSPEDMKYQAWLGKDSTLLQIWYKLDENVFPPVYRLLPISTHYPDFLSMDKDRKKRAKKDWSHARLALWKVLQHRAAEALGLEEASQLLRTVLDWELETGLQPVHEAPAENHCHCYRRVIPDLYNNLNNELAAQYVDLLKGQARLDPVLNTAHQRFMDRLHKKLRHTNIYERNVMWGDEGLNAEYNRSHQFYMGRISSHLQRTVISSISKLMKITKTTESFDEVRREVLRVRIQEEIQRHVNYGLLLAKSFSMRQAFLADVRRAMERSNTRPILLLAPAGWGKSTTMAAVAQMVPSWLPGAVKVLVNFIGFTGESRNIRLVLQSLCFQLAESYCPHTQLSEDLPQLVNDFYSLLGLVGAERSLVVVLDGLDELSEEHGPELSWLSSPLPPNIHIILSMTTDSLNTHSFQSASLTMLTLPPLNPDEIKAALQTKLRADRRCPQEQQRQLLVQACLSCPCPLYLEAAYSESLLWTSYSCWSLPASLEGLYLSLLARLERDLGKQLVRRAASLISISRWGVTEEELLHLLAKDVRVLQEVVSSHPSSSPPRVPYVLWARLKSNLGRHLSEVRTDETWVYRWTHSKLSLVCINHYLKTEDSRMAQHADYADYYRDTSSHAHIFQPLAWTTSEEEDGVTKVFHFNLRKLHGLPYHLVRSGQIIPFLSECIFNYEFLLHKAWGLSVLDLKEDLKKAVLPDKVLVDVEVLSGALEMSQEVLQQDPCQLASQLMGRLGQMVAEDRPVAKGDPLKFNYLHGLLAQCAQSSLPVLLPSSTCLLPPGGPQSILLAGHLTSVTALGGSQRKPLSVTSESDGSLRFWDLEQRRIIRSLDAVGGLVADHLLFGLNDKMLIICMRQSLQVREVESGRVVYSEDESVDIPVVTTTNEGQLLVVFYDGSHRVKVFDLASSCSLLHCVDITMENKAIHRDRSILLSNSSIRDYVLFAYRCGGEAAVFSARGGRVLSVLSARLGAACIQAVEMTEDYLLLFCRYPYKRGRDIVHIELFCPTTFLYKRSILGCSQDCISQVSVNKAGTHAVAFCTPPHTGITELVTWNLETEDHKHITRFPAVLTKALCFDLHFCLGICSRKKYLLLWDLTSSITDQTLTYNIHKLRNDGTEDVFPMGKTTRYAVCRSIRTGTVCVWNLARRRFVCRPVRVEHGLYSSTDVVLVHDFKLYIFTDRNINSLNQFQTLLIYDLLKRSYVRRQTGMAISPCLQHEYHLLEGGQTLLGLSETRDYLILWDLNSGSINHEIIPPSHRERRNAVHDLQPPPAPPRHTAMMPWDIRTESQSAKKRRLEREAETEKEKKLRLEREKFNVIDQYLLSGDEQVVVCSYFAHHLSVFSLASREHLHTLEDEASQLNLLTAALTHTGSHLVLTNYDEEQKSADVTLWDLHRGTVRERRRNEPGVCCIAVTDNAERIIFGVSGGKRLMVWEPFKRRYRSISGYGTLRIDMASKLFVTDGGTKAFLLSEQLSLWDLETCTVLSVLSLEAAVSCVKLLPGWERSMVLGLSHSPALITVTSTPTVGSGSYISDGEDVFGESSSSEEEGEHL